MELLLWLGARGASESPAVLIRLGHDATKAL